ncbi:MAG: substrate-binding domain-containing protein, partial [Henriciella sp.]|nr:substrate-binding domain-containing protein [Henriciella sp.]
ETGYGINASARNLRRQASQAIGIVIPRRPDSGQTISDPFFLEMVGAVSHAASQQGYDLIVSVPQNEDQIAERRLLQTGRADGLIVIGQAGRAERLNMLGTLSKNIVVWGGRHGETNYTLVGSDNLEGGRIATEHLLKLGRKRILFLGDIELPEVALRYDGLKKAHDLAGAAYDPELILKLNFGGDTAFNKIAEYCQTGLKFDAIFAASDVLAMSAIHALNAQNLRVPEDVSVVGYDDIGQAALVTPSLTTVDQNIAKGGEMMVDLLLRKISGESVASALTPTRLVVRKSCGAATPD